MVWWAYRKLSGSSVPLEGSISLYSAWARSPLCRGLDQYGDITVAVEGQLTQANLCYPHNLFIQKKKKSQWDFLCVKEDAYCLTGNKILAPHQHWFVDLYGRWMALSPGYQCEVKKEINTSMTLSHNWSFASSGKPSTHAHIHTHIADSTLAVY